MLLICGVYGLALCALIFSYHVSWAVLDLFLVEPYVLGTHTTVWMNWHAVGCGFVGTIGLLASRPSWVGEPRRSAAWALFGIYSIWSLQNTWCCVMTEDFTVVMWLHAILCALCAIGLLVVLRRSARS